MTPSDYTKDWSNPHLRVRFWFSIRLFTLYHAPYDKETSANTLIKEL